MGIISEGRDRSKDEEGNVNQIKQEEQSILENAFGPAEQVKETEKEEKKGKFV